MKVAPTDYTFDSTQLAAKITHISSSFSLWPRLHARNTNAKALRCFHRHSRWLYIQGQSSSSSSFYWTRRLDPETRAFFGYTSKLSKQTYLILYFLCCYVLTLVTNFGSLGKKRCPFSTHDSESSQKGQERFFDENFHQWGQTRLFKKVYNFNIHTTVTISSSPWSAFMTNTARYLR